MSNEDLSTMFVILLGAVMSCLPWYWVNLIGTWLVRAAFVWLLLGLLRALISRKRRTKKSTLREINQASSDCFGACFVMALVNQHEDTKIDDFGDTGELENEFTFTLVGEIASVKFRVNVTMID